MKTHHLAGGIFITAAMVCTASVFSGAGARIRHEKKLLKESQLKTSEFINKNLTSIKKTTEQIPFSPEINKAYQQAIDSMELKAMYEKVHLYTLDSFKKATLSKV